MDWEPKLSKKGNAVYVQIGMWCHQDQSIHIANQGDHGFHVSVVPSPDSRRGHPTLYRELSRMIKAAQSE